MVIQPNLQLSGSLPRLARKPMSTDPLAVRILEAWIRSEAVVLGGQRWRVLPGGCTLGVPLWLRLQLWLTPIPAVKAVLNILWVMKVALHLPSLVSRILPQGYIWLEFICWDKSSNRFWSLICEPICLFTFRLCLQGSLRQAGYGHEKANFFHACNKSKSWLKARQPTG